MAEVSTTVVAQQEVKTEVKEVTQKEVQGEEKKEVKATLEGQKDWKDMIAKTVVPVVPAAGAKAPEVVTETKPVAQSTFYKDKYNESDFVLMFMNPTQPLENWMVKELLENIDVKARGIRQGKTGKCYADFEDQETWLKVKALNGEQVGETTIFISDVPPRTDAPKNGTYSKDKKTQKPFNKKQGGFGQKHDQHPKKHEKTLEEKKKEEEIKKKKEEAKKKAEEKKVVLNEEEKDEGWEVCEKGAKQQKKKTTKKTHIDGIVKSKKFFDEA
ncbi:hypothetical protein EIN_135080 [Entamoeba invadens IP1]|uniref:RRM domain-containing protein n=1 Tax=Entamoeba invadens IP1 TaxID=370355 RepID=A0A0A1U2Z2_ENTIV|nr:hypothetical protein EIN_135080 [Entamoeba invadens IP1]ELP85924.1 hypothetical protein EIN_135080 [Entamoeba invadens IP1]|eukprot:XP_004185270.1 hypothetical protein EIN_135080 [Entamoeba invadens IP1]